MSDDSVEQYLKLMASVEKEYQGIYKFCKEKIDADNPHMIAERLARFAEYLPITGRLKAQAKYVYTVARRAAIIQTPQAKKELLDGDVANEQRLLDSTERLNAAITHEIDALRSLLSWHKENFSNSRETAASQNKRHGDQP